MNQSLTTSGYVVATWQDPTATDNSGEVPKVTCSPPSGSTFTLGHTAVTCEAKDNSGNIDRCSFQIHGSKCYMSWFVIKSFCTLQWYIVNGYCRHTFVS